MNTEERIKEIFAQALEKKSRPEREQYLNVACHDDPELRREIESLLRAAEQAGDFLHPTIKVTESNFVSEIAGTRIGRYKLLEQIGEGGFGVVWMAEQEEPVRRRVALKIIKLGMDTKEVVARFEAERQALAMLDHSNIPSLFDGWANNRAPARTPFQQGDYWLPRWPRGETAELRVGKTKPAIWKQRR